MKRHAIGVTAHRVFQRPVKGPFSMGPLDGSVDARYERGRSSWDVFRYGRRGAQPQSSPSPGAL